MVGEVPFKSSQQWRGYWYETSRRGERKELAYCPSPLQNPSLFLPAMSGVTMLLDGLVKGSATCLFFNFQNEI